MVVGTEDVLITPFTCDRTGSGDAIVAGIMRKLTTFPEMYENQDTLERQLRFAIAAGIISQWTIGAKSCTESERTGLCTFCVVAGVQQNEQTHTAF